MSVGIMSDFPFFKIFCVFSTMSICGFYNWKKDLLFCTRGVGQASHSYLVVVF